MRREFARSRHVVGGMANASQGSMKRYITHACAASLLVAPLLACGGSTNMGSTQTTQAQAPTSTKGEERVTEQLNTATNVLREMTQGTDIPKEQRDEAHCVIVVPNMGKGAFIVGGQGGKGVVACRTDTDWSAPAFVRMGGVTVGLQAGGQRADLIILATTTDAPGRIFTRNFQFGAGASVAAGPVGAGTHAATATQADFLTYARARGLFAGVDVSGMTMKADDSLMSALYGAAGPTAVLSGQVPVPPQASGLVAELRSSFPQPTRAVSER